MAAPDPASTAERPQHHSPVIAVLAVIAVAVITVLTLARPVSGLVVGAVVVALAAVGQRERAARRPLDAMVVACVDDWRRDVAATMTTDAIAASVLGVACDLSGARRAEVVLIREGVGWRLGTQDAEPGWHPLPDPLGLSSVHSDVARGSTILRLNPPRRGDTPTQRRRRSDLLGDAPAPALLVPLRGSHAVGTLLVADPVGRRFAPAAEAKLQLLAAHVAGALDTSLAIEQIRHAADRQLRTATTDMLTGLPNRAEFVERVDAAARLSSASMLVAVLLVNLDRFREINATFGHHVGDQLLRQFGVRLRDSLPVTATVARLGGDEFAVLLCELRDQQSIRDIAEELLGDLARLHSVGGAALQLEASIGVALAPLHGDNGVALLQRADIAMEAAKGARSGVEIYDPSRGARDGSHLQLLADLRRAIDGDELWMVYQPKAGLRTHEVRGVEALLRWEHATRGRVPPGEFIPIAERTGLIHPLTRWVLRRVMAQQQQWRAAGLELEVAVNLSARNLLDDTLPNEIAALLNEYQVPARLLRLEITESSLIVDPGRAEAIIAELHRLGISLSVDDFGTGYSSLAHLLRLPVDEIKVDRSFVSGLLVRRSEAAIVRATVDLGRRLEITVTAEGVEDQATWTKLAELGCDLGQGYWLARPMDAVALERWLDDFRTAEIGDPTGSPTTPVART
jgi:diguanylate cyclase (GGDEF)-like protein